MRLNLWEPVMESYNFVKLVSRKHCCRGYIKILVIEWQDSSCLLKVTVTNKLCLKHMTLKHLTCTNHLQYRTHSLTTATNVTQANGSVILFEKTDEQQKENKNKKAGSKTFLVTHKHKKERLLQNFLHYRQIQKQSQMQSFQRYPQTQKRKTIAKLFALHGNTKYTFP